MRTKSVWPSVILGAGLEAMSFLCWLSDVNPNLTKIVIVTGFITDLYALSQITTHAYKAYKNSRSLSHFFVKLEIPIFSEALKRDKRERDPVEAFLDSLIDLLTDLTEQNDDKPSLCRIS